MAYKNKVSAMLTNEYTLVDKLLPTLARANRRNLKKKRLTSTAVFQSASEPADESWNKHLNRW
jgi:hypothetical protein